MRTRRSKSSSELVPPSSRRSSRERSPPLDPSTNSGQAARGKHLPVLLQEAIEYLAIQPDDTVVDATLGGAGHAIAIAEKLSERGTLIGFDLDADAVARAKDSLASVLPKVHLIEGNFRDVGKKLDECGIPKISKVLFDLGWSSFQLGVGRGFSFLKDEPLQMTYAKNLGTSALTAARIVNEWDESSIADVLYGWGEERYARRIARKIVERRALKPFTTSRELAEMIKESVPAAYRHGRIHPATRTFQALRIAVNDELGALERGLQGAWEHLIPGGPASTRDGEPTRGGRIAVITFHSIEDRLVKQRFVQWEKEGTGRRITKKPVTPSDMELQENPRSRSAKLRIIQKL